ncbi:hypothetical protein BDR22DRAFT_822178 [Usnea florida]
MPATQMVADFTSVRVGLCAFLSFCPPTSVRYASSTLYKKIRERDMVPPLKASYWNAENDRKTSALLRSRHCVAKSSWMRIRRKKRPDNAGKRMVQQPNDVLAPTQRPSQGCWSAFNDLWRSLATIQNHQSKVLNADFDSLDNLRHQRAKEVMKKGMNPSGALDEPEDSYMSKSTGQE